MTLSPETIALRKERLEMRRRQENPTPQDLQDIAEGAEELRRMIDAHDSGQKPKAK